MGLAPLCEVRLADGVTGRSVRLWDGRNFSREGETAVHSLLITREDNEGIFVTQFVKTGSRRVREELKEESSGDEAYSD